MLRYFRHIRKTLMEQNKVRTYLLYAIGEISLVMIGILLALQVNNWNETRNVRASELEILHNLKSELLSNKERLTEIQERHSKELEDGLYILTLFGTDISTISTSKLDSVVGNIETGFSFEANDGYIKSLIASNRIDYIQNIELRSYLSSFDRMIIDAIQENEYVQRLLHERFWPAIDGRINSMNRIRLYEEYENFPRGSYPSDYEWFFNDREVEDIVSNITSWKQTVAIEEQTLQQNFDVMIDLVDLELEKLSK